VPSKKEFRALVTWKAHGGIWVEFTDAYAEDDEDNEGNEDISC